MPQLKHVITEGGTLDGAYCLPDPLSGDMVLENLQTLYVVSNLKFGEGVLKRIPNITKLKLYYRQATQDYCLNNLHCLHKLESLGLRFSYDFRELTLISFPHSLKKLTLQDTRLPWEDMTTKIGSLPLLQVLQLRRNSFTGSEWETFEGQLSSLKFLMIGDCDLECWITDNTHFPRLERLVLRYLSHLREIPLSIGDIPTLRLIELEYCSNSVEDSAYRIKQEQEELGNEDLQVRKQKNSSG